MTHAGPPAPRQFLGVMVSSTFADFRQHREVSIGAISGQGLHPIAMEQDSALPAGNGDRFVVAEGPRWRRLCWHHRCPVRQYPGFSGT